MNEGAYCEYCDTASDENDWMPVTRNYEQRMVCPNCGAASLPFLSENSQLMGDYLLSVADDEWMCGYRGAFQDNLPAYSS